MGTRSLRTVRSAIEGVELTAGPYPSSGGKRAQTAWLRKLDDDLFRLNAVLKDTFGVWIDPVAVVRSPVSWAFEVRLVGEDGARRPAADLTKVLDVVSARLEPKRDADILVHQLGSAVAGTELSDAFFGRCRVFRREDTPRADLRAALAAVAGLDVSVRPFPKGASARTAWLADLDAGLTRVNQALAAHGVEVEVTLNHHPSVAKPEIVVQGVERGGGKLVAAVSALLVPGPPGLADALKLAMTGETADEGFYRDFRSLRFGFDS